MIIITRHDVTDEELDHIRERVEAFGLQTHLSRGKHRTVVGCIGDEELLAGVPLRSIPGVKAVHSVMKPYKLANLQFAAEPTRVPLGSTAVGDASVAVVAGPCSVEGVEMLSETGRRIQKAGAVGLRGGAFKPRSSPYSFGGPGEDGLKMLAEVRAETGLPVVTEVMDTRQADLVAEYADVLQIGARNMQNFSLLTEVGRLHRPILLKRGMAATVEDLLLAAEYVMKQGNKNVILCERGIRTFSDTTRNTFDLAAIPVLQKGDAPSGDRRLEPCRRPERSRGGPFLKRGGRRRSRRAVDRGASGAGVGGLRWGSVAHVRPIRRSDGGPGARCRGGG